MIRTDKLDSFKERILEGQKRPITVDLFITEYCMAACDYCIYADGNRKMDFGMFCEVIDKLGEIGVKSVIISGGGEPLVHPNIADMFDYIEGKFSVGLNTNLISYNPRLYEAIARTAKWVKIGCDGWDRESYKRVKKIDAFDKVWKNVERLRNLNSEITITLQSVIYEKSGIEHNYNTWIKNLNLDYLSFRPIEMVGSERYYSDFSDYLEILNKLKSKSEKVIINYKWRETGYKPAECFANWTNLNIRVDGLVSYCCHKPDETVGHILDVDILERKSTHKTQMDDCPTPCRLSGNNRYLESFENNDAHWDFV
jgi:MoaA/NifB/PqqE/SkfB family radical SAM enzyme